MGENLFQVYLKIENYFELLASDMTIENATIFMRAWFETNYNEDTAGLVLKRQNQLEESI